MAGTHARDERLAAGLSDPFVKMRISWPHPGCSIDVLRDLVELGMTYWDSDGTRLPGPPTASIRHLELWSPAAPIDLRAIVSELGGRLVDQEAQRARRAERERPGRHARRREGKRQAAEREAGAPAAPLPSR